MDFFLRDPLKELAEISERGWFARIGPPGAPFGKTTREMRHQNAMYLNHWKKLGGQPERIEGVASYFRSEHHAAIPANRIPATLWADILTGDERVRTSDPGDVHLLSPALSIAHFILTDVRARRRILRRGLDTEWGAKVYSVRELPELMDALRLLEKP